MYEPVDEIRAVDIKRAGDWTDLHFDDGGGWSTLRLHFDDGGCQTCGLHFDDGEGTSSSNHRYANSQEGRRFCVTHRCRGVSHRMYFGVGSSYRIVITPNSGEVFDTEGE